MSSGRSHLIQYLFSLSNNCSCSYPFVLQCFIQANRSVLKKKKNTYMSLSSFPTFWQALQVPAFMLHSKCVCVCVYIWALYKIYSLHTHWRSFFTLALHILRNATIQNKEPIQKRGEKNATPKSLGKLHTPCRYQEIPFSYEQRNSYISALLCSP